MRKTNLGKFPVGNSGKLLLVSIWGENNSFFLRLCLGVENIVNAKQVASGRRWAFPDSVREGWQARQKTQHQGNHAVIGQICFSQLASVASRSGWNLQNLKDKMNSQVITMQGEFSAVTLWFVCFVLLGEQIQHA